LIGDPYVFLLTTVFLIPAACIAIPAHELGHALVAQLQGDPTARNRGFFKLDPRPYFNVYGLLAIILARVGWGEPVPINEYRLRGVGGRLAYAFGGPAANLILAVVFGILLRIIFPIAPFLPSTLHQPSALSFLTFVVYATFFLNLSVMAFNLLPIPGLDGWRVLEALFRSRNPRFFFDVWSRRQTIWALCAIVLFISSFLGINLLNVVLLPFYAPPATLIFGQCIGYPPAFYPCPASGRF
jgi:Zn-dependent protease